MGITISNSQVYFLGSSLWKVLSNICRYSVDKYLVKQNITFFQTGSFASPSRVGLTLETLAKISSLAWLFIFQLCALHVALSQVSFSRDTREIHLFILLSLCLHTLSYSSLTIRNPHTFKEIWLKKFKIKFGTELKPTQNSCKSQHYNLPFWLFRDKTPKQTLDLNVSLGHRQNSLTPNSKSWETLAPYTFVSWNTCT